MGAANCTAIGIPRLLNPVGTTTVGNPAAVHGDWNAASPVVFSPSVQATALRASSGCPPVPPWRSCRLGTAALNFSAFRYVAVGVISPISIPDRTRGP